MVVHGRSGGLVPECLSSLIDDLQTKRSAPVQLQALTAEECPYLPDRPILLLPLLLWPGSHARHDLPAIREIEAGALEQVELEDLAVGRLGADRRL